MTPTFEYNAHTVSVTDDFRFAVAGPCFETDRYDSIFESAQAAREKIDARMKAQEAQDRVRLSIPVMNEKGQTLTITGVHARNFNALGLGEAKEIYPPHAWIVDLLRVRAAARKQVVETEAVLKQYRIDQKPYGLRTHEDAIRVISQDAERKTKAAADRAGVHDVADFGAIAGGFAVLA